MHYNDGEAIIYGRAKWRGLSVRCLKGRLLPSITTIPATNITRTTATAGGEITNDGGEEVIGRGVCWSTSENPTIADNHTSDGTGIGTSSAVTYRIDN